MSDTFLYYAIASGKVKGQESRIVGVQSTDKTKRWRIDYDVNEKVAHYNWWNGKEKGTVPFEGSQEQVESLIDQLTKTHNKTD